MRITRYFHLLFILVLSWSSESNAQFYNGSQINFGKNRVQYRTFQWNYYRFDHVDVYFYEGSKDVAGECGFLAEVLLEKLQQRFIYEYESRIQLFVYAKLSDLKQSNIGIGKNTFSTPIQTSLDNKVQVYFEDGRAGLKNQIYKSISGAFFNEYMFGADTRTRIKNSALYNLPDWFLPGLIQFSASYWDSETDEKIKFYVQSNKLKRLWRLEGKHADLNGYALWHFIYEVYGIKTLANIVEMTKVFKNVNDALEYLIGTSIKGLQQECNMYFDKRYLPADTSFVKLTQKSTLPRVKSKRVISQMKVSSDKKHIIWSENQNGKIFIKHYNKNDSKTRLVRKFNQQSENISDHSFPLMAWHPKLPIVSTIIESKFNIQLSIFDAESRKMLDQRSLFNIDKVVSFNYSHDGKKLLFSAIHDSKCDIGWYDLASNTIKWITNDEADDLYPTITQNGKWIFYSSNRGKKTNETENKFSLWAIETDNHDNNFKVIENNGKAIKSIVADSVYSAYYLSDQTGIFSLEKATIDSTILFIDSLIHYRYFGNVELFKPFENTIQEFIHTTNDSIKISVNQNNRYKFFDTKPINITSLPLTKWATQRSKNVGSYLDDVIINSEKKSDNTQIDLNKYRFFDEKAKTDTSKKSTSKPARLKQRVYETNYFQDILKVEVDRAYLGQTYQNFSSNGYINPGFSGYLKMGIVDILEHHHIGLAFRAGFNFSNNEYLLTYGNFTKRGDHLFSFHRVGFTNRDEESFLHSLRYSYQYVLSENQRLVFSSTYRNDRIINLANEKSNLLAPDKYLHWQIHHVEYVLDNTYTSSPLLTKGLKLKTWVEWYKQWNNKGIHTTVIGFDVRHYLPIFRGITLANRVGASASYGPRNVIFYLGGVDNALAPRYDNSLPIDLAQNYIFQALGTNMRGFLQNARNGNRLIVSNNELRFPIYKLLSSVPSKSNLLNHMIIKGFFDIGTAFTGSSPFSASNTFNQQTINQGPISVTLFNLRNPILYSYGAGLSTRILGYQVRFDYARGIDTGEKLKPMWHISFAHDF